RGPYADQGLRYEVDGAVGRQPDVEFHVLEGEEACVEPLESYQKFASDDGHAHTADVVLVEKFLEDSSADLWREGADHRALLVVVLLMPAIDESQVGIGCAVYQRFDRFELVRQPAIVVIEERHPLAGGRERSGIPGTGAAPGVVVRQV